MGVFNNIIESVKNAKGSVEARYANYVKAKEIQRMHSKIGISPDASQDEINQAIIDYVKKGDSTLELLRLSDEQRNDPEFILNLYRANNNLVFRYQVPSMHSDLNVCLEILEIAMKYIQEERKESDYKFFYRDDPRVLLVDDLHDSIIRSGLRDIFVENPEFVEMVARKYPHVDLIKLIDSLSIFWTINHDKKFLSLSGECLSAQAKMFGNHVLYELPKNHPEYTKIVGSAIECSGFDALPFLSRDEVLQHKDYILRAFEVERENENVQSRARKYLVSGLSPEREERYICHGDYHSYSYFDKEYLKIQIDLAYDDKFWDAIDLEGFDKDAIRQELLRSFNSYLIGNYGFDQDANPEM